MKKTRKKRQGISAESIAEMADAGKSVSKHFTNRGKMVAPPIQRVNVDFTLDMLNELDLAAEGLNVSRQAVIKALVRMGLNQKYLSKPKKTG